MTHKSPTSQTEPGLNTPTEAPPSRAMRRRKKKGVPSLKEAVNANASPSGSGARRRGPDGSSRYRGVRR